jgi:hypothetical protein
MARTITKRLEQLETRRSAQNTIEDHIIRFVSTDGEVVESIRLTPAGPVTVWIAGTGAVQQQPTS